MSSFLHLKAGLPSQNDEEFGYLTLLALKLFIQKNGYDIDYFMADMSSQ